MKSSRIAFSLLALVSTLAVALPAGAQDRYEPVGTVQIAKTEVGFLISVGGGRGVLKFQGREYPFRIGGLGVGGVGIHGVTASGNVYNMDSVSTSRAPTASFAAASRWWMRTGAPGSSRMDSPVRL